MLVKTLLASAALITSTWVGSGYAQPPGGVMPELDIDDDGSFALTTSHLDLNTQKHSLTDYRLHPPRRFDSRLRHDVRIQRQP